MQLTLGDLLADEKRLQKEMNDAVITAEQDAGGEEEPPKSKPKPKGRRKLDIGGLPRVMVELLDPTLEKTGRRIGFDESRIRPANPSCR